MDSFGIVSGGTRAQLLGREYADDWIKKKPPMSWFCMIFAFYEVDRHNTAMWIYTYMYTYICVCHLPTFEKGAFQRYNWPSVQWRNFHQGKTWNKIIKSQRKGDGSKPNRKSFAIHTCIQVNVILFSLAISELRKNPSLVKWIR